VTLEFLDVEQNFLTGTVPPEVAVLPNLLGLGLYYNSFTGTLPKSLARVNLKWLTFNVNQFSGSISQYPFGIARYERLGVKDNRMHGTMPPFALATDVDSWTDVTVGETLGEFIPVGESCSANSTMCTSGEDECSSVNQICCKATWSAPSVRASCSGYCLEGTGECVSAPTAAPTAAPSSASVASTTVTVSVVMALVCGLVSL
jgi:hypothetical protein